MELCRRIPSIKNVHMCYIGVTEGKIEKEGKMSFSIIIFIYTIHLAYLKVNTKFENTGSNRSQDVWDRNFQCLYVLYKRERRKKWKFEKRRQNED